VVYNVTVGIFYTIKPWHVNVYSMSINGFAP